MLSVWFNCLLQVYQTTTGAANAWTEVTVTSAENQMVTFESRGGGIFVAKETPNLVIIASVAAACIVVILIFLGTLVYFKRFPDKIHSVRTNFNRKVAYARRSLQAKV